LLARPGRCRRRCRSIGTRQAISCEDPAHEMARTQTSVGGSFESVGQRAWWRHRRRDRRRRPNRQRWPPGVSTLSHPRERRRCCSPPRPHAICVFGPLLSVPRFIMTRSDDGAVASRCRSRLDRHVPSKAGSAQHNSRLTRPESSTGRWVSACGSRNRIPLDRPRTTSRGLGHQQELPV
jgi:hypothetical protein